jgi:hypothetical protein
VLPDEAGFLKPDNNVAENAIRPFVLGRSCLSKLSIEDFFASMFSIASFFGRNF